MKKKYQKITLFLCLTMGLTFSMKAQTEEENSRKLYQEYLEDLNLNDLNTSFLLNKGYINEDEIISLYQFIEGYEEETNEIIAPVSQMDGISWMQTYGRLLENDITPSGKTPSIEEVENSIDNLPKENSYNEIHLFGAMSYMSTFYKKNITFELNTENYFFWF